MSVLNFIRRDMKAPIRGRNKAGPLANFPQKLVRACKIFRRRALMALKNFDSYQYLMHSRYYKKTNLILNKIEGLHSFNTRGPQKPSIFVCLFCFVFVLFGLFRPLIVHKNRLRWYASDLHIDESSIRLNKMKHIELTLLVV